MHFMAGTYDHFLDEMIFKEFERNKTRENRKFLVKPQTKIL